MRFCTSGGNPPGGWPIRPLNRSTTDSGKASSRFASSTSSTRQVVGDHEQRHVADGLRRRRDLDDVAEQLIHLGVHPADFRPAVGQAQRLRLLEQIRVLPAGHFVRDRRRPCWPACRFRTARRTRARLPSSRPGACSGSKSSPVSRSVKRSASTSEFRFGCDVSPDIERDGAVGDVQPCFGGLEHRRRPARRWCRACGSGSGCRSPA